MADRPVGRLADDEVCACLLETGERKVEIVERCIRCGALMRSDAYHDAVDALDAIERELGTLPLDHLGPATERAVSKAWAMAREKRSDPELVPAPIVRPV